MLARYLGGKGLAADLLTELNPPGVDPLAPENTLIFATGPLGNSMVWGSCRYGVYTKSPLTGLFCESYAGGKTPDAIDAAGFDAVVIQGRAAEPTVLVVHPDGAEFHPAGDIWGMETYAAEDAVRRALCPAGVPQERGRRHRSGGRKPGALRRGRERPLALGRPGTGPAPSWAPRSSRASFSPATASGPQADPDGVKAFAKNFMNTFKDHAAANAYKNLGTPMLVKMTNTAGAFPTRYWQQGTFEHWEKISAEALVRQCSVKPNACAKCFMACGQLSTVKEGRHAGLTIEGPEYETIYAFGGLVPASISIEEIAYLNDICDRLGIDTITSGNLCAFTIEAVKRGKVDFEIDYGDVDAIAAAAAA